MLLKIDVYLSCILVLLLKDHQKEGNGFFDVFVTVLYLFVLSSSTERFGSRKCEEHWLESVSRLLLYLFFYYFNDPGTAYSCKEEIPQ